MRSSCVLVRRRWVSGMRDTARGVRERRTRARTRSTALEQEKASPSAFKRKGVRPIRVASSGALAIFDVDLAWAGAGTSDLLRFHHRPRAPDAYLPVRQRLDWTSIGNMS